MAVITGAGAVSAVGVGLPALRAAFDGDKLGIVRVQRFPTTDLTTHVGAFVPGFETRDDRRLCIDYALMAAREALAQARLEPFAFEDCRRVALVLGSSLGSGRVRLAELTDDIARELGIEGPRLTVSTACTSSANAVGLARDLLSSAAVDVVLAGGSDVLTPELFAGFHALGVLARGPCSPFGLPTGTTLGEGAGFFVLEHPDRAKARGVAGMARVLGYGLSCDAYHPTSPDPSGSGIARAVGLALDDAGIAADAVDYVNAHGTGTDANDAAEVLGIVAALGSHRPPVSSSKSFLGHAQGAAGILELVVSLEALRAQRLPPTVNLKQRRRGAPADPVETTRPARLRNVLSVNAAFAGANSAVLLGEGSLAERAARVAPLEVVGTGMAVGGEATPLQTLMPMADPRGLDASTRYLATACARALASAGVNVKGDLRDRVGIVGAATTYSFESGSEFHRSVSERGLAKLNATAFAKLVLNAPTGATARLLSLRGPTSTLTTGCGGGLVAIAYAATILSRANPTRVAFMLGAGFDELGHDADPDDGIEGAGALVLRRAGADSMRPRLVAWAMGAPGAAGLADTLARALDGHAGPHVTLTSDDRAPSAGGAMASVRATELLATGRASRVVVTSAGGGASAVLVFEGGACES